MNKKVCGVLISCSLSLAIGSCTLARAGNYLTPTVDSSDSQTFNGIDIDFWYEFDAAGGIVRRIQFSPDGSLLATVAETIRIWKVEDRSLLYTLRGHEGSIQGVAFSPDGSRLASVSIDETIRIWRVSDGAELRIVNVYSVIHSEGFGLPDSQTQFGASAIHAVDFSADGKMIAVGIETGKVVLLDSNSLQFITLLDLATEFRVNDLEFSPDSEHLVVGTITGTVEVWDLIQKIPITTIEDDKTNAVSSVHFSPDGQQVLAAYRDGNIRLWNAAGDLIQSFQAGSQVWETVFLFDVGYIVSVEMGGILSAWRLSDQKLVSAQEEESMGLGLDFDVNNQLLATSGYRNGGVRIWKVTYIENE